MKTRFNKSSTLLAFGLVIMLFALRRDKENLDHTIIKPQRIGTASTNETAKADVTLLTILQVPMSPTLEHVWFDEDTPEKSAQRIHSVKALLQKGEKVNIVDEEGKTPLIWACATGRSSIAALLLRHGAALNLQDHKGETALHYAVWEEQVETVKLLLKHRADLRVKDIYGNTPLGLTSNVHHYHLSAIGRLLQLAGASD